MTIAEIIFDSLRSSGKCMLKQVSEVHEVHIPLPLIRNDAYTMATVRIPNKSWMTRIRMPFLNTGTY